MGKVNADEVDWQEVDREETGFRRKNLGEATDGEQLGCSLYEIPPGKKAWPYHYHEANEEAIFVLEGEGSLRWDGETHDLREGDYVTFPADESGAHRVINDSDAPLRYLAVSTMDHPDVMVYPDSGKIGVVAGAAPGDYEGRTVEGYWRREDDVDYWEGEG